MTEKYEMVMPFVTTKSHNGPHDDESYVAGYEMGVVDSSLSSLTKSEFVATMHASNLPQADLIAMRHTCSMEIISKNDDWVTARFVPLAGTI